MTTTARTATRQIATTTAALFELVILGIEFDTCEICEMPAAELFPRIDNRDGAEVECCEDCAINGDVSWTADHNL